MVLITLQKIVKKTGWIELLTNILIDSHYKAKHKVIMFVYLF